MYARTTRCIGTAASGSSRPPNAIGEDEVQILDQQRKAVYAAAKQQRPERWSGEIRNWSPILKVWLNPENTKAVADGIGEKAA